jgi:hypothetical protein
VTAIPAPPRPLARWRQLALRILTAAWRVLHSQPPAGYPLVDGGLPTGAHPESVYPELAKADEEWLAAIEAELWPDDQLTDDPPEGRR